MQSNQKYQFVCEISNIGEIYKISLFFMVTNVLFSVNYSEKKGFCRLWLKEFLSSTEKKKKLFYR